MWRLIFLLACTTSILRSNWIYNVLQRDAIFVCSHCLHPFRTKRVHNRHVPNCQRHPPQDVKYPDPKIPKERVSEFQNKAARFRLPFYQVCDFDSFLTTLDHEEKDVDAKTATNQIDEHNVCGFPCQRVSEYPEYQTPSYTVDHK